MERRLMSLALNSTAIPWALQRCHNAIGKSPLPVARSSTQRGWGATARAASSMRLNRQSSILLMRLARARSSSAARCFASSRAGSSINSGSLTRLSISPFLQSVGALFQMQRFIWLVQFAQEPGVVPQTKGELDWIGVLLGVEFAEDLLSAIETG